jgi:hypothetical protein
VLLKNSRETHEKGQEGMTGRRCARMAHCPVQVTLGHCACGKIFAPRAHLVALAPWFTRSIPREVKDFLAIVAIVVGRLDNRRKREYIMCVYTYLF